MDFALCSFSSCRWVVVSVDATGTNNMGDGDCINFLMDISNAFDLFVCLLKCMWDSVAVPYVHVL